MNVKDICKLKYINLDDDKIIFNRAKTIITKRRNQKPIIVIYTEGAKRIINK